MMFLLDSNKQKQFDQKLYKIDLEMKRNCILLLTQDQFNKISHWEGFTCNKIFYYSYKGHPIYLIDKQLKNMYFNK